MLIGIVVMWTLTFMFVAASLGLLVWTERQRQRAEAKRVAQAAMLRQRFHRDAYDERRERVGNIVYIQKSPGD